MIHMIFITEELFEVAIENWPEWDLNPRPLNSVQTTEFRSAWFERDLDDQMIKMCCSSIHFIYSLI